jgi:CRP-like cAMP-binding protein
VVAPGILQQSAFFAELDEAEVNSLAAIATKVTFERGDLVCKEGDPADTLYLLLEGWVDVFVKIDSQGRRRELLATLSKGDIIGWSAVVHPYIYTTSVMCASPVETIGFQGDDLLKMFVADQKLGCTLMTKICQVIASRLLATRQQMVSLAIIG